MYENGVYKMWYHGVSTGGHASDDGIGYVTSADGINWSERKEMYHYKDKHGDTHNHALWCPDQNKYVLITRLWTAGRFLLSLPSPNGGWLRWPYSG